MPTEPFFHIALLHLIVPRHETPARENGTAPPSLSKDGEKGGTVSNRDYGETDGTGKARERANGKTWNIDPRYLAAYKR